METDFPLELGERHLSILYPSASHMQVRWHLSYYSPDVSRAFYVSAVKFHNTKYEIFSIPSTGYFPGRKTQVPPALRNCSVILHWFASLHFLSGAAVICRISWICPLWLLQRYSHFLSLSLYVLSSQWVSWLFPTHSIEFVIWIVRFLQPKKSFLVL